MITGILPYVKITSLNPDANMVTIVNSDILVGSPERSQSKVVEKDQVPYERRLFKWIVCPKITIRKKSILREVGKLGSKHAVTFSKGTWHHVKNRERKGPSQGVMQKCEPQERIQWAPQFEERTQDETLKQE